MWHDLDEAGRQKLLSLASELGGLDHHASELDAFVVLLERGLGGSLVSVATMALAVLNRVLGICSTQHDTIPREDCAELPGDARTATLLTTAAGPRAATERATPGRATGRARRAVRTSSRPR